MRIDKVYIEEFKNLKYFSIDLDPTKMHTVLLGQNAAGKSNLLEALVIIFRDLDLEDETFFNYELEYQCKDNFLRVEGGPNTSGKFKFYLGIKKNDIIEYSSKMVPKVEIKRNKENYLPKYVFSYYSGISNRLLEHFDKHQTRFYKALLEGVDAPPRPLFYARQIHSYFVLMAFYAFSDKKISAFLKDFLGIIGLESVLFVLKEPVWAKNKKDANPYNFWSSKGVVRNFLDELWGASMAPIVHEDTVREDFRRTHKQEQLYLYISNQAKLIEIAKKYGTNTEFFKSLESTYISDLIQEVRVKVKKVNIDGDITFKELSEGEQQLLTVLGLLRFTKEDESLILLDEPDTHLNPLWKWKYMNLLEEYSGKDDSSQILMTTHDPLVIGGLKKEEIRIFQSSKSIDNEGKEYQKIETFQPDFDPKGLGVAGILTSEFFNLPSTLDEDTLKELNERNDLIVKQENERLTEQEHIRLTELFYKLSNLGINTTDRDPLYQKFIIALANQEGLNVDKSLAINKIETNKIAFNILEKIIKESEK
ncbi:AAA ATPase-like protein [Flavobacterium sp. 90]|uniref:AAA family ATPase n=1 Tax=unclassified Flavobacterium TaxID=196869 RepID=UPI000EB24DC3|nr:MULTISPECIES: ATP-binding protein [unclassified Flavobacterium]RKR10064.1 AAA ATPase-like protein [Flavobacterium sp. 81]TCK53849.1 AAA ATPase-like protein [Flavobacterium sp. 90]